MKQVNVMIVRQSDQINEDEVQGEWFTEAGMQLLPGWTKSGSRCFSGVDRS